MALNDKDIGDPWNDKGFEERMAPYIDKIYYRLFTNHVVIHRSNRTENDDHETQFMDRELAIDTFLHLADGTVLTFQEKTRRNRILEKYGADFTFEYYNDPETGDQGEWFKLAAQLYFYGYATEEENGYSKCWILNVPELRLFLKKRIGIDQLEKNYLRRNSPPAKANFFAIPFTEISENCVLYKWERNRVNNDLQ